VGSVCVSCDFLLRGGQLPFEGGGRICSCDFNTTLLFQRKRGGHAICDILDLGDKGLDSSGDRICAGFVGEGFRGVGFDVFLGGVLHVCDECW